MSPNDALPIARVDEETEVESAGDGTPNRGNGAASNGEEWVGEAGPLTDVTHPELTTDTLLIESSCRVGGGEVVTNTRSAGRASAVADDEDSDRKSTRLNSSH